MGEGRTEPHNADRAATERRATVGEAAGVLGITAEAVRSRIKRGTLRSTKEGSTVYVILEGDVSRGRQNTARTATEHDRAHDQTPPEHDQTDDRTELVDVLRDQVEYLREQLGEEREARRRADMLLARLAEANAALAGEVRELTAPQGGLRDAESGATGGSPTDTPEAPTAPQAGAQEPEETARRPWWLRLFGG